MCNNILYSETNINIMPRKKTNTKTSAKKSPAKKSLEDVEYIDGQYKTESEKAHELSRDIEELLSSPKNPFGTNSIAKLEEKMEGMNLRQIQEMAVSANIYPSGNKTTLKNKLRKEFKVKYGTHDGGRRYLSSSEAPVVEDKKVAEEVMRILNER